MIFMIVSLVFILAFPAFGSAMTGYSAVVSPYVQDREHNYVPSKNFTLPSGISKRGLRQIRRTLKHISKNEESVKRRNM
jgi:hypothetical protein